MIFFRELLTFFVKVDQHSGGSDTSSIAILVIRHLETDSDTDRQTASDTDL